MALDQRDALADVRSSGKRIVFCPVHGMIGGSSERNRLRMDTATENVVTDATTPRIERPRRFHFEWVPLALMRPRALFGRVAEQRQGVWQAAILLLTLTALLRVVASGAVAPGAGEAALPPDFEYYGPEQQAQFAQAAQVTSGPVFRYVLPAIGAVLGVWLGWLVVSGALHLTVTLLGGRGNTLRTANTVAWAGAPFALRDVVRAVAVLASGQTIASPGLSGFAPSEATGFLLFLKLLLVSVDLYLIWHIGLLILGLRAGDAGLPPARTGISVTAVMIALLAIQALTAFGIAQLGNLTVMRPFLF